MRLIVRNSEVGYKRRLGEFLQYSLAPAFRANAPFSNLVYFLNAAILKVTTFRFAAGRTEHN